MRRFLHISAIMGLVFVLGASAIRGAETDSPLMTKEGVRKVCDQFMQNVVSDNVKEAFAGIKPYFTLGKNSFDNLQTETFKQLEVLDLELGKPHSFELVKEESVRELAVKYTYVTKYQNYMLRWVFVFFKPKDHWEVKSIFWDEDIKALFY